MMSQESLNEKNEENEKKRKNGKRTGKSTRGKRTRLQKEKQFVRQHGNKEYTKHENVSDNVAAFQQELEALVGVDMSTKIRGLIRGDGIGSGIDGTVYRCSVPSIDGDYVVKEMQCGDDQEDYFDKLTDCMFELRTLIMLKDEPRVVPTLGGFISYNEGRITFGIVMKRMSTTLAGFLENKKCLKLNEAAMIAIQLLEIARLTLRQHFLHHDLHMQNILCDDQGTNLCVCDYGHVAAFGRNTVDVAPQWTWEVSDYPFSSAHAHYSRKHRTKNADESCDHYSIAVHILEVLHGFKHEVVAHFKHHEPARDVLLRTKACSRTSPSISLLGLPIRVLLKRCIDAEAILPLNDLEEELTKLKNNDAAKAIEVNYRLS